MSWLAKEKCMCEREKGYGEGGGRRVGLRRNGQRVSKGMREGWREEEDRMEEKGWLAEGKY